MKTISVVMYVLAIVLAVVVVSSLTLGIANHNLGDYANTIAVSAVCGVVAFIDGKVASVVPNPFGHKRVGKIVINLYR